MLLVQDPNISSSKNEETNGEVDSALVVSTGVCVINKINNKLSLDNIGNCLLNNVFSVVDEQQPSTSISELTCDPSIINTGDIVGKSSPSILLNNGGQCFEIPMITSTYQFNDNKSLTSKSSQHSAVGRYPQMEIIEEIVEPVEDETFSSTNNLTMVPYKETRQLEISFQDSLNMAANNQHQQLTLRQTRDIVLHQNRHQGLAAISDGENYQEARYKTELCLHYRDRNQCPFGNNCLFAHGLQDLRPYRGRHPKHKTKKCVSFHQNGYCNYGYRCSYIHTESPRTIEYIRQLNYRAEIYRRFRQRQQRQQNQNQTINSNNGNPHTNTNINSNNYRHNYNKHRQQSFQQRMSQH